MCRNMRNEIASFGRSDVPNTLAKQLLEIAKTNSALGNHQKVHHLFDLRMSFIGP
ncbi:hypothetical protein RP20_CCG026649 [Aedes albopictus]|nr:hypothetical protein RP20_CCG026649 [Aedes albopictus]